MNTLTGYVIVAAALLLLLAAFAFWRRRGSTRLPLSLYIIGVTVVWAVLLAVLWFSGNMARFQTYALVFSGFALGMLAMYIAVHVYKS